MKVYRVDWYESDQGHVAKGRPDYYVSNRKKAVDELNQVLKGFDIDQVKYTTVSEKMGRQQYYSRHWQLSWNRTISAYIEAFEVH